MKNPVAPLSKKLTYLMEESKEVIKASLKKLYPEAEVVLLEDKELLEKYTDLKAVIHIIKDTKVIVLKINNNNLFTFMMLDKNTASGFTKDFSENPTLETFTENLHSNFQNFLSASAIEEEKGFSKFSITTKYESKVIKEYFGLNIVPVAS